MIQLLSLLKNFKNSFDGTLGDWSTEPVNLQIKPCSKLFNSIYYQVPKINRENFCKELKQLVEIGVLTLVQNSQYGTPSFVIPKKEGTVRFITDFLKLKHKLVKNMYPINIIGETMNQMVVFQYAT